MENLEPLPFGWKWYLDSAERNLGPRENAAMGEDGKVEGSLEEEWGTLREEEERGTEVSAEEAIDLPC